MNASLSAEKHAPERVVSRWFLRAGSIEEVSRLNIGFGFMRSWMKAGIFFFRIGSTYRLTPAHADSRKAR